ncbi:unnamed protein product [Brassica oleracea var. botrytis]|nr:unnamed protein product [Brassica napus]
MHIKSSLMDTYVLSRLLVLVLCIYGLKTAVHGAGECGRNPPDREAIKLAPCAMAAQDKSAKVSATCCVRIKQMGKNPKCLCAVMLSSTARNSGAKPEISMTIPKRCNIADRPIGYKCGGNNIVQFFLCRSHMQFFLSSYLCFLQLILCLDVADREQ